MTISVKHYGRGEWGIRSSSYSPILRQEAKLTPGMRWEPAANSWVGYADAVAVTAARAKAKGLIIQGDTPTPQTNGVLLVPIAEKNLRDYQKVGVKFLVANAATGALLADDVGLGKGAQAIIAARALRGSDGGGIVVVCPSFARDVWRVEFDKWWPKSKVALLSGVKNVVVPPKADVDALVLHYDILYAWSEALMAWGPNTLILDEIQALMSEKSRRTQAAAKLARVTPNRCGLSATPMTSRPKNLWAPVDTLSEGRLGRPFAFYLRYADAKRVEVAKDKVCWVFDGASNLNELHERMKFFMLRRLKSDVALQLPARTRQIIEVNIAKGHIVAPTQAMRSDRVLRKSLDMSADGKIPQVIELVCSHLESGAKVVVGTYRKAVAEAIAEGVAQKMKVDGGIRVITGDVAQSKRDAIIREKPDLLCCTLDSTKEAINLSFASVAVVAELVWVPATLTQWEGRFGRFEGANILVQYVLAKATVDMVIAQTVIAKLDRFHEAIGKTDDGLREDFAGLDEKGGAAARLKALWDSLGGSDD